MAVRPVIGLTAGDPAGVGPELLAAALNAADRWDADLKIIGNSQALTPGQPSLAGAKLALEALIESVREALAGKIQAIVTGPVSKNQMHTVGFAYPGQTEFFAAHSGVEDFLMILTSPQLTVGLVTAHVPLRTVPDLLSESEILRAGRQLVDFVRSTGKVAPRIAVAGLNPHAGEQGDLGTEELEIIEPATQKLRAEFAGRAEFTGPISPDTLFFRAVGGEFDAVLCMYHDQGLIPLKLLGFDHGVNVSWGLPFVRTSPDHGTAFQLAGKGLAKPESFFAAIGLAVSLSRTRIR